MIFRVLLLCVVISGDKTDPTASQGVREALSWKIFNSRRGNILKLLTWCWYLICDGSDSCPIQRGWCYLTEKYLVPQCCLPCQGEGEVRERWETRDSLSATKVDPNLAAGETSSSTLSVWTEHDLCCGLRPLQLPAQTALPPPSSYNPIYNVQLKVSHWFQLHISLLENSTPLNFPDNLRDISGISMQAELLIGREGGREGNRQCKFLCFKT